MADGYGLLSINGESVHYIDGIPTILRVVYGNYAKGVIVRDDLTMEDCYVAKGGTFFAHGKTLKAANKAVLEKVLNGLSEEERIARFMKEYPSLDTVATTRDLYDWHHRLTGSCEMGRRTFASDHEVDIDAGEMTVGAFIALTENAYGGSVIKRLGAAYKGGAK